MRSPENQIKADQNTNPFDAFEDNKVSPENKKNPSIAFIFVIDPPALVLETIILTASFARHFPNAEIIAYCPEAKARHIPKQLHEYFEATNTKLQIFTPEFSFEPHYKQGNKLFAAAQPRPHDFTVFLDTDIVAWQPFDLSLLVEKGAVSAAPEGLFTWGKVMEHWEKAYGVFGMDVPSERVNLVRSGAESPPYFNAGVVAFPNDKVGEFANFGECWLETARELDKAEHDIPIRRPWLDQITLPIAIRRAGLRYRALSERFNQSLSRKLPFDGMPQHVADKVTREAEMVNAKDPLLIHYHHAGMMQGVRYEGYIKDLLQEFTIFDSLQAMNCLSQFEFDTDKVWAEFGRLKAIHPRERTPEQHTEFALVDAQKHQIKQVRHNPDQHEHFWPESILSPSLRKPPA